MKLQRNIPKDYPNIAFFGDLEETKDSRKDEKGTPKFKPYLRLILYLKTPKGKYSKFYQTIKANLNHVSFKNMTLDEVYEYCKDEMIKSAKRAHKQELKKGYTLGNVYILSTNLKNMENHENYSN